MISIPPYTLLCLLVGEHYLWRVGGCQVLQHLFNCNTWREADSVNAMSEENCSMMTGIVITAEVEIPAASVFCTLKHLKKRKVCWMMISCHTVLCTSYFQWWEEERSALLSHILTGEEGCMKKSQGTLKIMNIMFFVCWTIPFHFKVQSVAHIMLHLCDSVWPLLHRKPTQLLQHGVLLKHNTVSHYHPDVQDLLQAWD